MKSVLRVLPVLFASTLLAACGAATDTVTPETPSAESAQWGALGLTGPTSVTIGFRPVVDGVPFNCGTTYHHVGTTHTHLTPTDFRFFVQDLKLVTDAGVEVPVAIDTRSPWQIEGVALLDFENAQGRCSGDADTNSVITGRVPAASYRGVVFSNGVPEVLNHSDPATLPPPLTAGGTNWGWRAGFRFFLGSMTAVSGSGGSLLHTGATACTGNDADGYTCRKPNRNVVRLTNFDPAKNVIVADLGAAFSTLNLSSNVLCHGDSPVCAPMFQALGIDFNDGSALSSQSVYSVK